MVWEKNKGEGQSPRPFRTGGWRVEPARCLLVSGSQEIRLEPKVMDVLVCLARRADEVVSREELIRDVWEGRFVGDEVISVAVFELRKALGDNAREPRWVETIPRRGYRWMQAVVEDDGADIPVQPQEPRHDPRTRSTLYAAAVVLLFVMVATLWIWRAPGRPGETSIIQPPEAEVAYRKGQYFMSQRTPAGLRRALAYFEQATRLDPEFAEAHSGVAQASVILADLGLGTQRELNLRARAAAEQALALDGGLAEAHAALGLIRLLVDWDLPRAEQSLRRAISLSPDLVNAHRVYAWLLSAAGRHPEAILEARRALALDPVSPVRYHELAWALQYAGRHGEALTQLDKAHELDPNFFQGYISKGTILDQAGDPTAAFEAYCAGYRRQEHGAEIIEHLKKAYEGKGLAGVYGSWLEMTLRGSPQMPQSEVWLAQLYTRVGETEQALQALERAYEEREGGLLWLQVDPSFQPLRHEPRFQRLLRLVKSGG